MTLGETLIGAALFVLLDLVATFHTVSYGIHLEHLSDVVGGNRAAVVSLIPIRQRCWEATTLPRGHWPMECLKDQCYLP